MASEAAALAARITTEAISAASTADLAWYAEKVQAMGSIWLLLTLVVGAGARPVNTGTVNNAESAINSAGYMAWLVVLFVVVSTLAVLLQGERTSDDGQSTVPNTPLMSL